MSITDDLIDINDTLRQANAAVKSTNWFGQYYRQGLEINRRILELKSQGNFDAIPTNAKAALKKTWDELKAFLANIESDRDMMEVILFPAGRPKVEMQINILIASNTQDANLDVE